ncbi:MAG TPA: response regulator, partial [Gemmatimonadales bacterium]
YKIAAALRGVLAQRLMRKLCNTCKEVSLEPPPEELKKWIPYGTRVYRAAGCPDCAMTGYLGRFAVLEVLTVTPEVERRIAAGETADRIADAARAAGMPTLFSSGVNRVLRGESTIEDLLRVVDVPRQDDRRRSTPAPADPRRSAGATTAAPGRATPTAGSAPVAEPFGGGFELLEEAGSGAAAGARGGAPRKVLLVDDEDSLRKVLKDLLERDGYDVSEARDGVQALDQVDRVGPDVVVLDLNLPALDGYGVLSQLRSRPATAGIPVIVLTAKGDEDNEVRVFELGADDFLQKPFRARALSARLEAVLGRRKPA